MMSLAGSFSAQVVYAESIVIGANSKDMEIRLTGEQTHDEYRDVYVRETCTRLETIGYRTECHNVRDRVCRDNDGHPICHDVVRSVCHEEPVNRWVEYDCSHWEKVFDRTVTDFIVTADLTVKIEIPAQSTPAESIHFDIDRNGMLQVRAFNTSKQFLIMKAEKIESRIVGNQDKRLTGQVSLKLVSAEEIRRSLETGITDVTMADGKVGFTMLGHALSKEMEISLHITRQRTLWFSKRVIKDRVGAQAVAVKQEGNLTRFEIDLSKLQLKEGLKGGKKYNIQIDAEIPAYAQAGQFLNLGDLGSELKSHVKEKHVKY